MSESQEKNNHVSIVVCHYAKADDWGEEKAQKCTQTRSEMLREVIASVSNTDFPAEVIVVDNGGNPDDSDFLLGKVREGVINTYVRNKENMYFGWAWNQGAKLATGKWIHFTCNDIAFKPGWLSQTMWPLLEYPDRKYIVTPLITPDKDFDKYNRGLLGEHRLNTLSGSASMIMRRETFEELGEFTTHRVAGSHWHMNMHKKGYMVVAPPTNMADHLGKDGGVNFNRPIEVKKTLLTGEVLDYSTL